MDRVLGTIVFLAVFGSVWQAAAVWVVGEGRRGA